MMACFIASAQFFFISIFVTFKILLVIIVVYKTSFHYFFVELFFFSFKKKCFQYEFVQVSH